MQQHKLLFRVADISGSVTLAVPLGILRSAAATAAANSAAAGGATSSIPGQLSAAAVGAAAAAAATADTAAAAASVAAAGTSTAEAEALKLLLPPSSVLLLDGACTTWAKGKLVLSVNEEAPRSGGPAGRISVLGYFSFPFCLTPYIGDSFAGTPDNPWQRTGAAASPVADPEMLRVAEQTATWFLQQKHLRQRQRQHGEEQDALTWIGQPDPIFALEED